MFRRILVPTDLTERSLRALDAAEKMCVHDVVHVTLLHVIETIEDSEFEEFESFYNSLKRRAQKKMEDMVKEYSGERMTVIREIIFGKRVREILKYAHENRIDLIILNSRKIDPQTATQGWSTISHKVSVLSHCPVLLIKESELGL